MISDASGPRRCQNRLADSGVTEGFGSPVNGLLGVIGVVLLTYSEVTPPSRTMAM